MPLGDSRATSAAGSGTQRGEIKQASRQAGRHALNWKALSGSTCLAIHSQPACEGQARARGRLPFCSSLWLQGEGKLPPGYPIRAPPFAASHLSSADNPFGSRHSFADQADGFPVRGTESEVQEYGRGSFTGLWAVLSTPKPLQESISAQKITRGGMGENPPRAPSDREGKKGGQKAMFLTFRPRSPSCSELKSKPCRPPRPPPGS